MVKFLTLLVLLTVSACSGGLPHEIPGSEEFFLLAPEEQTERIVKYSPADQVALYLTSLHVEPPDYGILLAVAKQGENVLPAILDRLSTGREFEAAHLIRLLYVMDRDGYYPIATNKSVMAALEARYESMAPSYLKERVGDEVNRLRSKAKTAGQAIR